MLFLLFQLGQNRYAVDVRQIEEVLPTIELRPVPRSPVGLAGTFNYRGTTTPVIDLTALALGRPSRSMLSTRMLMLSYCPSDGHSGILGILCEQATEMFRGEEHDFKDSGITVAEAPYLGRVATTPTGLVQLLRVDRLLSPELRASLFCADPEPRVALLPGAAA